MKFLQLRLDNYIGIYNGMGLSTITIDFTRCIHRIIVIRGLNGSGKSTIMKAASVFPDPNNSFIPGEPAFKRVVLENNGVVYQIDFIHGVNKNKEREVTKVHLFRNGIDLNENGNVKSYRDLIFDELSLDPNFESLSDLSLEDRGLADKKPAERKKFVNSILSSMQAYNRIWKSISKKSLSCKSMINNISTKLRALGDIEIQMKNIEDIERQINQIQDDKDKAAIEFGTKDFQISLIDPDGGIQRRGNDLKDKQKTADSNCIRTRSKFVTIASSMNIDPNTVSDEVIDHCRQDLSKTLNTLTTEARVQRVQLENLMSIRESQSQDIQRRSMRLSRLTSIQDYDKLIEMIAETESSMRELQTVIGINLDDVTEDEYAAAIDSIQYIEGLVKSLSDDFDYSLLTKIFADISVVGISNFRAIDVSKTKLELENAKNNLNIMERRYSEVQADLNILSILGERPKECSIDSCYFVREAITIRNKYENPETALSLIENDIKYWRDRILELQSLLELQNMTNACYARISNIVREIKRNQKVFNKLNEVSLMNPNELFRTITASKDGFYLIIENLKNRMAQVSLVNQYKAYQSNLENFSSEKKKYEDKMGLIAELQAEIDKLNKQSLDLIEQIKPKNAEIRDLECKANAVRQKLDDLVSLDSAYKEYCGYYKDKMQIDSEVLEIQRSLDKISNIKKDMESVAERIRHASKALGPLMRQRDSINHSLRLSAEYNEELTKLKSEYNTLELIKKYSSPTTGIQLVFIQIYMGKIISLANELLSLLFEGRFTIMPFIINENEFRIPCQGDGYQNDDISSMSAGQISMISMILSFAILYNSSTTYNIIKLDEIDGPLDGVNRGIFLEVLEKIMDIMHTEQCIMISHNSELDINNTDVILLENSEYTDGNVIWRSY